MRTSRWAAAIAAVAILAACGHGDPHGKPTKSASATPVASPSTVPSPSASPADCALIEQANLIYTVDPNDHQPYQGDLWQPRSGASAGVVVIHGGGFTTGTRDWMTGEAKQIACAGFAVLNIDYRLDGKELDAYTDAKAAASFLRTLVTGKVGAHGTSARAFLAPRLAVQHLADAGSAFSGGGQSEANLVTSSSKPLYLAKAVDDNRDPSDTPQAIAAAYITAGVPERYDSVAGSDHGTDLWGKHPDLQAAAIAWLQTYLGR
jgi:dienelactone hydrolase